MGNFTRKGKEGTMNEEEKSEEEKSIDVSTGTVIVVNGNVPLLYLDKSCRDGIVAASSFLVILRDRADDGETKTRIDRVINGLSNMLYPKGKRKSSG
jgi:hypothetical protein